MDDALQIETLKGWGLAIRDWFFDQVLVWDTLAGIDTLTGTVARIRS